MAPGKKIRLAFILALCCLLLTSLSIPILADIIITIDGGKIVGEIIKEDAKTVTIKTKYGNIHVVNRDDIDDIIRGKTYRQDYEKKLKDLKNGDIEGLFKIAIWCKDNTLRKEYIELIKQVLEFYPNHAEARREWKQIRLGLPPAERAKYDREEDIPAAAREKKPERAKTRAAKEAKEIASLDQNVRKQIRTLIDDYLDTEDAAKREDIIEKLKALEPVSKTELKSFTRDIFKKDRSGPRIDPVAGTKTLKSDKYPGTFILRLPGSIGKGKVPLLVGLHGGGQGVGDGATSEQKWGMAPGAMGAIAVFPTVIQKVATAWNTEREECYVIELIRQLKRSFNIDPDRVYLCGHSMGGYGTWSIGTRYADLFAAISPNAGGVFMWGSGDIAPGTVANLKNTPIYFYHGSDDNRVPPTSDRIASEKLGELKAKYGPYEYVFKEYDGIGHGYPPGGFKPIMDWMAKHKRDPYPEMVIWEPSRAYKNTMYWIRSSNSRGRIEAKRKGNAFELTGVQSGVTIFANDKMINASKPVTVTIDGKEAFNGYLQPSVSALLESAVDKGDVETAFTYRIDL